MASDTNGHWAHGCRWWWWWWRDGKGIWCFHSISQTFSFKVI